MKNNLLSRIKYIIIVLIIIPLSFLFIIIAINLMNIHIVKNTSKELMNTIVNKYDIRNIDAHYRVDNVFNTFGLIYYREYEFDINIGELIFHKRIKMGRVILDKYAESWLMNIIPERSTNKQPRYKQIYIDDIKIYIKNEERILENFSISTHGLYFIKDNWCVTLGSMIEGYKYKDIDLREYLRYYGKEHDSKSYNEEYISIRKEMYQKYDDEIKQIIKDNIETAKDIIKIIE